MRTETIKGVRTKLEIKKMRTETIKGIKIETKNKTYE